MEQKDVGAKLAAADEDLAELQLLINWDEWAEACLEARALAGRRPELGEAVVEMFRDRWAEEGEAEARQIWSEATWPAVGPRGIGAAAEGVHHRADAAEPAKGPGASSSPGLELGAAQTSAPSGAPEVVGTPSELPPSAEAASPRNAGAGGAGTGRRPVIGGVAALLEEAARQQAAEAEAVKGAQAPPFCAEAQPSVEGEEVRETYRWRPGPASWNDVVVPPGLSAVERLTYVWGPVAEIVDWIAWGAPKSSRSMALSVALGVVGILEAWRYEGPTESGTHLMQVGLAKTAAGKDHPRKCGINLMRAVAPELLGPTKFASGPGLEMDLAAQPVMLSFMDEMGDQIKLITDQASGQHVQAIIGILKTCWNGREFIRTGSTKREDGVEIIWPVVGLIGTATPELFFSGLRRSDMEGGFINRLLIVPYERGRPVPRGRLKSNAQEAPGGLVEGLKRLLKVDQIDPVLASAREEVITLGGKGKSPEVKPIRVEFGPGAMEIWDDLKERIGALEDTNARKYEIGARTPEQAVRLATVLAASTAAKAPVIDRRTMAWAAEFAELSLEVAWGGYTKYMRDYLEFPDFCEAVLTRIREAGGWSGTTELRRQFRRHTKKGFELGAALNWLMGEARIVRDDRKTGGHPMYGWRLVDEE